MYNNIISKIINFNNSPMLQCIIYNYSNINILQGRIITGFNKYQCTIGLNVDCYYLNVMS